MDTNMIIAIATVLVVFVSFISTIIAAISVKKQTKYNKDNVRPICSIYLTDYKNLISVRIENDGLGPAKIEKIECVYANDKKAETIYELLPENLKHEVFHNIITSIAKKLTITANEKLYLLSITPKDDITLQEFRNFLKNIKITVKYSDLYNKEDAFDRELDFFGKNFGKDGITISDLRLNALIAQY